MDVNQQQNDSFEPLVDGPVYKSPFTVDTEAFNPDELQLFMERVHDLPLALRQLMFDPGVARTINEKLAQQFNLDAAQTIELTRIVRDVLISTLFVGDLVVELSRRLNVDEARGQQITNALIGNIFEPVMEDIRSLQVRYFADRMGEPTVKGNTVDLRG